MLEERIEKSSLGKIKDTVRKSVGIYLLAGGLTVSAISGCGPETEKCALPTSSKNYVGTNRCPNLWGYGTGTESWADGCNSDQDCICEKPKGESDTECECGCEDEPKPHEPVEKW